MQPAAAGGCSRKWRARDGGATSVGRPRSKRLHREAWECMALPWRTRSRSRMTEARAALQSFWGQAGFRYEKEMVELLRSLTRRELDELERGIPAGGVGTTAGKCIRAREIVRQVRKEK